MQISPIEYGGNHRRVFVQHRAPVERELLDPHRERQRGAIEGSLALRVKRGDPVGDLPDRRERGDPGDRNVVSGDSEPIPAGGGPVRRPPPPPPRPPLPPHPPPP